MNANENMSANTGTTASASTSVEWSYKGLDVECWRDYELRVFYRGKPAGVVDCTRHKEEWPEVLADLEELGAAGILHWDVHPDDNYDVDERETINAMYADKVLEAARWSEYY